MFCPNAVVWGDVATWFAGIFTMLAVAVAVVVYVAGERSRRKNERRSQAELVSGWVPYVSSKKSVIGDQSDDGYRHENTEPVLLTTVDIALVNNSHGVVYGVTVVLSSEDYDPGVEYVEVGNVGPGMWQARIPLPPNYELPDAAISLYFSDQREVTWLRNPNGTLVESPPFDIPSGVPIAHAALIPVGGGPRVFS